MKRTGNLFDRIRTPRSQALLGNAPVPKLRFAEAPADRDIRGRMGRQSFPTCVPKQSLGTKK